MLLSDEALVLLQSSGSSFCHQNTFTHQTSHTRHLKTGKDKDLIVLVVTHHFFVLQVVVSIGDNGLRTSVQQLFNAAFILSPTGGTQEVQAEAPHGVCGEVLQKRSDGVHRQRRSTQEGLEARGKDHSLMSPHSTFFQYLSEYLELVERLLVVGAGGVRWIKNREPGVQSTVMGAGVDLKYKHGGYKQIQPDQKNWD